ncbi:hypothetical protein CWO84_02430 [Methylomonas sp. Kb3]|nr:hypothetical protein CWO84_02430 [Methylomonas sp. Kb3]
MTIFIFSKCTNLPFPSDGNGGTFLSPSAAPSTGGFERNSPIGASHGCGALHAGAGKPLQATPFKPEERRKQAAAGWPFLWILSFGQAKESISAVGPRPDFKNHRRVSDTNQIQAPIAAARQVWVPTQRMGTSKPGRQ